MPSSYDQWRSRDEAWTNNNHDLVTKTYQWFLEKREWPDIELFQRVLDQSKDRSITARSFAESKPGIPSFSSGMPSNIPLQAHHIVNVIGADTLLNLLARATKIAYTAYMTLPPDAQLSVTKEQLAMNATPGELSIMALVPEFAKTDWPTPFSGGSYSDEWSMSVVPALVRQYEDVTNAPDYIANQLNIIREHCNEHDKRIGNIPNVGQLKAFVVMPFDEPWSDAMHALIKRVVRTFDGEVETIRADEIAIPGRINDQIVGELETCDFIIADITGNNVNVGFELGFAHANDKPCVILRSKSSQERAPFDIYDHRRVDYSAEPTEEEQTQLIKMIQSAIDKVRSSTREPTLGQTYRLS